MALMVPFLPMSGLGNMFVVLDRRRGGIALDGALAQAIAAAMPEACDQIIAIDPPRDGGAASMDVYNRDGSAAAACGNGLRCVARLLMDESGATEVMVETAAGARHCRRAAGDMTCVDMGRPGFGWEEIPLARPVADTARLEEVAAAGLSGPCAVSMGNPHAVFFVPTAAAVDLSAAGPLLEHHALFPQRANISAAEVGESAVTLKVWERGAGETQACGTAACAAVVAAQRCGRMERRAAPITVSLPGGDLFVAWRDDDRVTMTGPTRLEPPDALSLPESSLQSAAAS